MAGFQCPAGYSGEEIDIDEGCGTATATCGGGVRIEVKFCKCQSRSLICQAPALC